MKNKFFIFLLTFLLFSNLSRATQFQLDASDIILSNNRNLITASDGLAISNDKNIKIEGLKFEYNKNLKILKSFNSITFLNKKNLEIKSDRVQYDEIKSILIAEGNVEIYNRIKKNII